MEQTKIEELKNEGFKKIESGDIWSPVEVGQQIKGVLADIRQNTMYDNHIFDIETENGKMSVFGTSQLETLMSEVKQGDFILIVYNGEVKTQNGRMRKDFDVFIKEA